MGRDTIYMSLIKIPTRTHSKTLLMSNEVAGISDTCQLV